MGFFSSLLDARESRSRTQAALHVLPIVRDAQIQRKRTTEAQRGRAATKEVITITPQRHRVHGVRNNLCERMFTRRPPRLGGEFRGFAAQYFAQAAEILNYSSTESAERGFDFIVR